jgi:hypothetical protein
VASRAARCSKHPGAPAAWRCTACQKLLCVQCTERVHTGGTFFDGCLLCQGVAAVLMTPGTRTFPQLLRHFFAVPLRLPALLTVLATLMAAVLWAATDRAQPFGFVIVVAVLAATFASVYAVVLQAAATGPDKAGEGDSVELGTLARKAAWFFVPFGLALSAPRVWMSRGGTDALSVLRHPLALGLVGVAAVLWPILAARVAVGTRPGLLSALRPALGACVALTALFVGFMHLATWNAISADSQRLYVWGFGLRWFVGLTVLATGWLHGLMVHACAPALGFSLGPSYQVPVAPEAVPAHTREIESKL